MLSQSSQWALLSGGAGGGGVVGAELTVGDWAG